MAYVLHVCICFNKINKLQFLLYLSAKGTASSSSSGFFADLMNKASDLGENVPVISIETSEQYGNLNIFLLKIYLNISLQKNVCNKG